MLKKIEQNKNSSVYCKIHPIWYVLLALAPIIVFIASFSPVFASIPESDYSYCVDITSVSLPFTPVIINGQPFGTISGITSSSPVYAVFTSGPYGNTDYFNVTLFSDNYFTCDGYGTNISVNGLYYAYTNSGSATSNIRSITYFTDSLFYSSGSDRQSFITNYLGNPPNPPSSASATIIPSSSWLFLGTNSNNQSVYIQSAVFNDSAVCFYQDSSYAPGYIPAVVSKNNYGVIYRVAGVETSLSSAELVVDGVTWYSKYSSSLDFVVTTPNPDIGVASSSVSADNACIDAINSAYPSDGRANLLYYLPGGNVAYTLLSEYSDVALLQISSPSVISSSDFSSFNVRYGWASELPSSAEDITSVTLSLLDPVSWSPSGPTDILGRSSMAQSYIDTSGHSGDYLVVFNPFAHGFSSSTDNITEEYVNPDIMINVSQIAGQKIYGVDSSFNPATGDYSYTGNGKIWDKDMSSPGNVYVDNEGITSNPEQGGGSNSNPATNFWTWLNGKFEELKNLFSTGHSMIQNLVGYGSDFMTSVQKLYTWLPDPVYSVLSSALVLVIIIGVVKCFL